MKYRIEIKQLVDYPRCRIYRKFVETLTTDRNLHNKEGSGLFYYVVLCSYANFRSSYQRIEKTSYVVPDDPHCPGLRRHQPGPGISRL